jgi:uncharacterized protein (TIGR03382 family)
MRTNTGSLVTVASGLFMSAVASAGVPIVSATYFDLSGNWNGMMFTAYATAMPGLMSSGSVARLVPATGTADFEPGFVAAANPADIVINLTFTPGPPGMGFGAGSFLITDADGDTISGNISGVWIDGTSSPPGQVYFNGTLSNVLFTGTVFDGTLAGAFSTLFGGTPPYNGAIAQLFMAPPGNFFTAPFSDVNTGVTLQIVPTPGALALLGLSGAFIIRRRR